MNGRVSSWSDWCRKMYFFVKNGAHVEVYDVLAECATKTAQHQPTWAKVPHWYEECSRMDHMPFSNHRELAECSQIESYLKAAGFTRTRTTERKIELKMHEDNALGHIQSLAAQAVFIGHLAGVPRDHLMQYYDLLMREAGQFGLQVRRYEACSNP